jgi:hypothetical protein
MCFIAGKIKNVLSVVLLFKVFNVDIHTKDQTVLERSTAEQKYSPYGRFKNYSAKVFFYYKSSVSGMHL